MSQVVRIMGARVTGMVYLGPVTDPETGEVSEAYSGDAEQVIGWLWDCYRTRFNQRRSLRSRRTYIPDPTGRVKKSGRGKGKPVMVPLLDADGSPALVPLGRAYGDDEFKSAFRASHPFAAGVPDLLLQHADQAEKTEWFAAAKRRKTLAGKGRRGGAMPFFRSRKREHTRFALYTGGPRRTSQQASFTRTGKKSGTVTLTGMNPAGKTAPGCSRRWTVTFRVRLSQPVREYTSVQVDWTSKRLTFVSPPPPRQGPGSGAVVGLDVGVVHTIATSDGDFYDQPSTTGIEKRIKRLRKGLSRKKRLAGYANRKGYTPTTRYKDQRAQLSQACRDKTNVLDDWRHKTTTTLVRSYDVIAYEALNVKGMAKSARGTIENPGKNVRAKAGLNRSLASSAFATLRSMIEYKCATAGTLAIPVDPRNTSRQCYACHHTAPENRESQAVFSCVKCGHTTNADTNAACNILQRGLQVLDQLPVAAHTGEPGHGSQEISHVRPRPLTPVTAHPLGDGGSESLQTTHTSTR